MKPDLVDPAAPPDVERRCEGCRYRLRGLPELRCPECGRAFDAKDLTSTRLGWMPGPVARRAMRPTRFLLPAARAWAVVSFLAATVLAFSPEAAVLVLATGYACVGFAWRIGDRWRRTAAAQYHRPDVIDIDAAAVRRARLIFVLTGLLIFSRLPFYATFWISKPFLDRWAHHVFFEAPYTPKPHTPPVLGLYPITGVNSGMSSMDVGVGLRGFVYCPYGPFDTGERRRHLRHVDGDWYVEVIDEWNFGLYR